MEITVRVEVQYHTPKNATVQDVLAMLRTSTWVRFMMRYISPRLKKASPVEKTVLHNLSTAWKMTESPNESECVICMSDNGDLTNPAKSLLPCGHAFHHDCIHAWLQVQSTCPMCRFQFPKAFSGTYAVHNLMSTLLLAEEQTELPHDEIAMACVANRLMRAVVTVTLVRLHGDQKQDEYPCELSAWIQKTNGETVSEFDLVARACELEETQSQPTVARLNEPHAMGMPQSPQTIGQRRKRSESEAESRDECNVRRYKNKQSRTAT